MAATPDSYRASECLFAIYFGARQAQLTGSASAALDKAAKIIKSHPTTSVLIRRFDDRKRSRGSISLIEKQERTISSSLSLPDDTKYSFEDQILADHPLRMWYYTVDICDAKTRARREKEGPSVDAAPVQFDIGGVHLFIPLRYLPVDWGDPPITPAHVHSEAFRTGWPGFPDGRNRDVASCPVLAADIRCNKVITIIISDESSFGDHPQFRDLRYSGFSLFGGRLYFYPDWPRDTRIVTDLPSPAELHPDLSCTLPHNQKLFEICDKFSEKKAIVEQLPVYPTVCQLRIFPDIIPIRLSIVLRGTNVYHWREISSAVAQLITGMADHTVH